MTDLKPVALKLFTYCREPRPRQTPPRRLLGWSEVWRDDGGTRYLDVLFIRVWSKSLELGGSNAK